MIGRTLLGAVCLLVLTACASDRLDHPVEAGPAEAPREGRLTIHNLADDFIDFYDRTAPLPLAERREAFKATIAEQFPDFYNTERFSNGGRSGEELTAWYDRRIERAIETFPSIRPRYERIVGQFNDNLADYTASFEAQFEDVELKHQIYFVHSLGELDGGTRDFYGRYYLVFGADGMATYHDSAEFRNERPFFHHELFHVHHDRFFNNCSDLWCSVWREGLATLVADRLNPSATPSELLLNTPNGMHAEVDARLLDNLLDLRRRLEQPAEGDYGELFLLDDDRRGLPSRRGYYLGYLIARSIHERHSLVELARMSAPEVRPLFDDALGVLVDRRRACLGCEVEEGAVQVASRGIQAE